MARYIDADAFKRKLIDEKNFFPAIVARALDEMPTADVVPKSEYDAVVSAVDNSTKEFLKLHDDYQNQKRETDKWKQLFYDAKKVIGENAQRGLEVTLDEIEKAKADVAMEICCKIEEEIVAALESNYKVRREVELSDELYHNVNGKISALRGIEGLVAELKKKYTEGEE